MLLFCFRTPALPLLLFWLLFFSLLSLGSLQLKLTSLSPVLKLFLQFNWRLYKFFILLPILSDTSILLLLLLELLFLLSFYLTSLLSAPYPTLSLTISFLFSFIRHLFIFKSSFNFIWHLLLAPHLSDTSCLKSWELTLHNNKRLKKKKAGSPSTPAFIHTTAYLKLASPLSTRIPTTQS